MARIAVDMDEVMADTLAEHLSRYNRDHGTAVRSSELQGKWLWQVIPEAHQPKLQSYLDDPSFWAELPLMDGVQRVLKRMAEDHEIFVASAAMEVPQSFGPKFQWLEEHFPFLNPSNFVFCGTKSILAADFLIDDNPRQLRAFRGTGILFSSPHNQGTHGWPRVEGWAGVEEYFYPEESR